MNEINKTGIFAGIAGALALATYLTLPGSASRNAKSAAGPVSGDYVFKEYDPLSATTLKIIKYNKELAEISDFEVSKDKASGVWTIPSHAGYPADAEKQMSEAANTFINLKILDVVTERRDEHKMFGVVEPDPEKIQAGDEGIGTLVRIANAKGDNLANLVVGAPEKDNPKHRFVRIPSQDIVYIVELETTPLTTEFTKWIEPDLLKLSSTDIQTLGIRDYSILQTDRGAVLNPNFDADVSYTTTDGKWNADSIRIREGANSTPRVLKEDEQLNATKLNEIRNALDSLRIVDVRRKPKGLASNLKIENTLLEDRESMIALARRGFIPQKGADGSSEIFASSGELLATLRDGVQYLVRFGNTTGESSESETEKKEGDASKDQDSLKLDRYMLVTARVDESKFPQVVLKPLPETYDDLLKMEAAEKPALPDAVPTNAEKAPDELTPTDAKTSSESKSEENATAKPASSEVKEAKTEETKSESQPKDQASLKVNKAATFVSFQEKQDGSPEAKPAAVQEPEKAKPQEPETPKVVTEDEKKEKLSVAREKITKENQQMIDERSEKLQAAHKKVAELNARFADWFYVISETEYKRLRVTLDELIQAKSASTSPAGVGGFPGGGIPGGFNPGAFAPPR